jgi:toxin FitB
VSPGFLLGTNVVSELVAPAPEPRVLRWMTDQDPRHLFLSVITLGELAYGVARLDAGRRQERLARWLAEELTAQFAGRVLVFDHAVTVRWGELRAAAERQGRPRPTVDLQLAATAAEHSLTVATRNVADFEGLGIAIVNPWKAA